MASDLSSIINELEGLILFIGSAARAAQLGQAAARVMVLDPHTKPGKVSRQLGGRRVMCADPIFPPLGLNSLGAVVVLEELRRHADGAQAVEAWQGLLRPGGVLCVVEPERDTPVVGSLVRLFTGAPSHRPPEAVAALLLNAGLARVGQVQIQQWGGVLTRGMKRVRAVACGR